MSDYLYKSATTESDKPVDPSHEGIEVPIALGVVALGASRNTVFDRVALIVVLAIDAIANVCTVVLWPAVLMRRRQPTVEARLLRNRGELIQGKGEGNASSFCASLVTSVEVVSRGDLGGVLTRSLAVAGRAIADTVRIAAPHKGICSNDANIPAVALAFPTPAPILLNFAKCNESAEPPAAMVSARSPLVLLAWGC
jgi:hypothetical protein